MPSQTTPPETERPTTETAKLGRVDSHAHVFDVTRPMAPGRRYTPTRSHTLADYLANLDSRDLTHGLLVQPSFLGTDNSYLVEALAGGKGRLKGVAVVDPTVTERTLSDLGTAGVVGIRYNLIGRDPREVQGQDWRGLSRRVAALGWHIEIQAEGRDLPWAVPELLAAGAPLVVDHFGKPDGALGVTDPGFQTLLAAGREGAPLHVKLSAPYRCGGADPRPLANALIDALGPERLMWGSDWPWTQHEEGMTYAKSLLWLTEWLPEADLRARVLAAPLALMG